MLLLEDAEDKYVEMLILIMILFSISFIFQVCNVFILLFLMPIMKKIFWDWLFLNCHILNEFNLLCHAKDNYKFCKAWNKNNLGAHFKKSIKIGIESSKMPIQEKGLKL